MYKLLLCWRYLLTRYLALACVVSVLLGVATLIVVNSVMSGFSSKLKERLHGLLSDVVVESLSYDGFPDADQKLARIQADPFLRDKIEALTPTMEVFAMLQFSRNGETIIRPIHLIGIDPDGRKRVGGFAEHLVDPDDRLHPSFALNPAAQKHYDDYHRRPALTLGPDPAELGPDGKPPPAPPPSSKPVLHGIMIGFALGNLRTTDPATGEHKDVPMLLPGDDVALTTATGQIANAYGVHVMPVTFHCVVTDYVRTEMSEYDSSFVYMSLAELQHLRTMQGRATSIQIKLKDYDDAPQVVASLRDLFPASAYQVSTWEQKQGPLLSAISIERGLLNILLFLIIAVAGFGILAIFSMIVVEKTRDIGILKALGASKGGIMSIFLGYGLLLGAVGAGLGTALGLAITMHINDIEKLLAHWTGQQIFDRSVYYFNEIPTDVQPLAVMLVNVGAVGVAVLFSILPALRAALLHPVRALRYE